MTIVTNNIFNASNLNQFFNYSNRTFEFARANPDLITTRLVDLMLEDMPAITGVLAGAVSAWESPRPIITGIIVGGCAVVLRTALIRHEVSVLGRMIERIQRNISLSQGSDVLSALTSMAVVTTSSYCIVRGAQLSVRQIARLTG